MNIIDGNGASEVLRLSALHANKVVKTQVAESFVKTIKRDYISVMPKPDGLTAAKNLAEAFEHYNEWHPHSALGYRSPREYLRQQASNGLSDNRCLEI